MPPTAHPHTMFRIATPIFLASLLAACTSAGTIGPVAGITRPGAFACSQDHSPAALDVTIAPEPGTANLILTSSSFHPDRLIPDGSGRFASTEHVWAATGIDTSLTDRRQAHAYLCREHGHVGAFGSWWPDPVRS